MIPKDQYVLRPPRRPTHNGKAAAKPQTRRPPNRVQPRILRTGRPAQNDRFQLNNAESLKTASLFRGDACFDKSLYCKHYQPIFRPRSHPAPCRPNWDNQIRQEMRDRKPRSIHHLPAVLKPFNSGVLHNLSPAPRNKHLCRQNEPRTNKRSPANRSPFTTRWIAPDTSVSHPTPSPLIDVMSAVIQPHRSQQMQRKRLSALPNVARCFQPVCSTPQRGENLRPSPRQ